MRLTGGTARSQDNRLLRFNVFTVLVSALLLAGQVASAAAQGLSGVPQYSRRVAGGGAYVYPVMGPRMSSDFGLRNHPKLKKTRHHHGIDLAAPAGAPIRAIAAGQVIFADPYAGYGNLIVVKHEGGLTSHYGHLEKIKVKPGQKIKAGAIIGTVGSTGISTGPHLHFEIRVSGQPRDPERFLPGLAADSEG